MSESKRDLGALKAQYEKLGKEIENLETPSTEIARVKFEKQSSGSLRLSCGGSNFTFSQGNAKKIVEFIEENFDVR